MTKRFNFNKNCFYSIRNVYTKNFLYETNTNIGGDYFNSNPLSTTNSNSHIAVFGLANTLYDEALFYIEEHENEGNLLTWKNKISNNTLTFLDSKTLNNNNNLNYAVFKDSNNTYDSSQLLDHFCGRTECIFGMSISSKGYVLTYYNSNASENGTKGYNTSNSGSLDHQALFINNTPSPTKDTLFEVTEQCFCIENQPCTPSNLTFFMGVEDSAIEVSILGLIGISSLLILII